MKATKCDLQGLCFQAVTIHHVVQVLNNALTDFTANTSDEEFEALNEIGAIVAGLSYYVEAHSRLADKIDVEYF
jgi:hypothetical protein